MGAVLRKFAPRESQDCNGFEIFGVDFLVDQSGRPWLLEINENPDVVLSSPSKNVAYLRVFARVMGFLRRKWAFLRGRAAGALGFSAADVRQASCSFNTLPFNQSAIN